MWARVLVWEVAVGMSATTRRPENGLPRCAVLRTTFHMVTRRLTKRELERRRRPAIIPFIPLTAVFGDGHEESVV